MSKKETTDNWLTLKENNLKIKEMNKKHNIYERKKIIKQYGMFPVLTTWT